MTYARARLLLGISGVGFWVLFSVTALIFDLPHRLLAGIAAPAAPAFALAAYIVLSAPFDLFGGYLLPRRHGRPAPAFGAFAASWLRGVLAQAAVIWLSALALLAAADRYGLVGAVVTAGLLMLLLLLLQAPIARLVGGLAVAPVTTSAGAAGSPDAAALGLAPLKPVAYAAADPGFVGGVVGLPGAACRLVVPAAWTHSLGGDALGADALTVQLTRRLGALVTGARARGVAVAVAWNLLGFTLAALMPGAGPASAAGLITTALWFTLWSFLGLLLLPSLNRPGVFELDRYALESGIPADALAEAIRSLDRLQDDEPARSRWVERIFHPIPSVESRIAMLATGRPRRGAWQCARTALYLSWACFGLLSRAVHCNSGRPQLWVLFPGD